MSIRDLFRAPVQEQDPAETWELPYTVREGGSYYRGNYASYPWRPRRAEDIPPGAREALDDTCGIEGFHQLFIIPWFVRRIGVQDQKVISPNSVLALGTRAVGLWTEKPVPGMKLMIPLEEIAALEDVTILLYGRLSLVSSGERLQIRYNTVARGELEPALLELRKRIAGPALRIPPDDSGNPDLPFKWKNLLGSTRVRLEDSAPVSFRFTRVPGGFRRGRGAARCQLLVLNPRELVYMRDPPAAAHPYGEDSFIVPRSRVTGARVREGNLELKTKGTMVSLSMVKALAEDAVRWLG